MTARVTSQAGTPGRPPRREVPRLENDHSAAAARQRMAFLAGTVGVAPEHIGRYSFDPAVLRGNVENFIGVAQVPIGIAGPLLVDGEHARGTFYVPLATTEGALVASYNRGMKLAHAAGGVRATVVADAMQRAPAFGFDSAREARAFGDWVTASFAAIKAEAEATTRAGRLHDIEQFQAGRFMFLRFNYTTGDAAGQNLTGRATLRACTWMRSRYAGIRDFYLEANLATDKKSSHVNILRTRGKRVVAEATIPADLIRRILHTTPAQMFQACQVSNGGGTGLPTQREGLELLGCYGPGQVRKFAEIVAATVLCGEISLGAAVVADEWVTAHERLGRNRPLGG